MKQKKVPHQDKINYLDEVAFKSTTTPGPGMYNDMNVNLTII